MRATFAVFASRKAGIDSMKDEHYFADVDLPFHVWVRERTGRGARWVLRHAAELQRARPAGDAGTSGGSAPGPRPATPR